MITLLYVGLSVALILGLAIFFVARAIHRRRILKDSLESQLYLVRIPKSSKKETSDFKAEINKFEQFLFGLSSLKKTISLEIAVPHVGEEIHFYISVHESEKEVAIKQIQGIWPGTIVERASSDYTIFNPEGFISAGAFALKENYALPLRTYLEIGADTLNPILGGFTRVNEIGEGAAVQIILRRSGSFENKNIKKIYEALKKGTKRSDAFATDWKALSPKKESEDNKEPVIQDEMAIKLVQQKLSKSLFDVNVRICVSATTQMQADYLLDGISAGFDQFSSPEHNSFKINKPKNSKDLIYRFIFREFNDSEKIVLNSEEVAGFCHFPISTTETPRVKWLKSKEAPAPENIPTSGTLVGESTYMGVKKKIFMTDDDRRRHMYLIGQTGTGKSSLISNIILEDIKSGKGVCIIDPHGELVENALAHIPKERAEDVIYFDPGDLTRPMAINMLDYNFNRPEEKTFIINEMLGIFDKLYDLKATGGPMFEQYMRNALLLLMEDMPNEPATLIEVPRLFTDSEFRKRKLARITNPIVVDFWEKEASKAGGEASLQNLTPYVTSKFSNFIANDYMRPIIGQPKSSINFREVMDSKKILLVNLSKGKIGDINANLLGMIFIGKLLMAAMSRVDTQDKSQLPDMNMFIDEFQNFATDSISSIFSEARKYKLTLTVAHQFIAQLKENIRDAVFGNVGSLLVMRVGAQDAEFLVKQFEPIFDQNDLVNIDNFKAHAKMQLNGETQKPFVLNSIYNPDKGNLNLAESIKELSRLKYGTDRATIEKSIFERLRA